MSAVVLQWGMNSDTPSNTQHPFERLDPDCVLDAVDSVGLYGDGRLLALNSYENRVYQVGREEGAPVVVKFYRPHRWTDAAILEEHAFVAQLAEAELPVVAPSVLHGATLHTYQDFRFTVFPRRGGRAPELGDPATLEWMGRFIGRIHAIGGLQPYLERPSLNPETFGHVPRAFVLEHGFIPDELVAAYASVSAQALEGVARCYARAGDVALIRLHGDCHGGNVLWTDDGPHFVDFDDSRMGPAAQDIWMLLSGRAPRAGRPAGQRAGGLRRLLRFRPASVIFVRSPAHVAADSLLGLARHALGTIRRFPALFPGSIPSATGRTASSNCANRWR